jgi:hypothetical protein
VCDLSLRRRVLSASVAAELLASWLDEDPMAGDRYAELETTAAEEKADEGEARSLVAPKALRDGVLTPPAETVDVLLVEDDTVTGLATRAFDRVVTINSRCLEAFACSDKLPPLLLLLFDASLVADVGAARVFGDSEAWPDSLFVGFT